MSWFARWRATGRAVLRRNSIDRDVDRELADWIDELTARYEDQGLSSADARRRALIDTEGVAQVKEHVRDARSGWVTRYLTDGVWVDLATAARSLRAAPGATAAAILTLAAAAGVNLGMFGVVNRALLSPPVQVTDPERLYTAIFHAGDGPASGIRTAVAYPTYQTIQRLTPSLTAAAFQRSSSSAVIGGDQHAVTMMLISGNYFAVLGAAAAIGGTGVFHPDEAAAPHAVISHGFWHSAFGADPHVVGRRLAISGIEYTVDGVMPPGFSGHSSQAVDVWLPFVAALRATPGWDRDQYRSIGSVLIRLPPGAGPATAETQMSTTLDERATLSSISSSDAGASERRVAWWLMGVSVLVFVIGLANAGTLLVVRAAKRRADVVVRAALGASQGRLIAQACLEAGMLAGIATALSFLLGSWLDEAIRTVLFPHLIARETWSSYTTLAALAAGLMSAIIAAAAGIWHIRLPLASGQLVETARGVGRGKTLTALLLVQTMLSVFLLAGAAMFGKSFYKLASQDFGLQMNGAIVVDFERGAGPAARDSDIFVQAIERVRQLPGVELATLIDSLPFGNRHVPPISVPGLAGPPSVDRQLPFLNAAGPEYMKILGIQITEGRSFTSDDSRGAPVVIVNETMARGVWPGMSAIGKCIRIGYDPDFDPQTASGPATPTKVPCREVIGVARDTRQRSVMPVDQEARLMQYYVPLSQVPFPPFMPAGPRAHGLLLRASVGAQTLARPIRRLVIGDRTDLPFVRVVPYARLLDAQLRPWKTATTLLGLFSVLALAVAAIGLYAAFAHAVSERRHEMAVRLAIGAYPGGLLRLILRDALGLAAVGAAIGCVLAVIGSRWVQSLLFETAASEPSVLASAVGLMLLVAAMATLLPARAAAKADPSLLLRVQ